LSYPLIIPFFFLFAIFKRHPFFLPTPAAANIDEMTVMMMMMMVMMKTMMLMMFTYIELQLTINIILWSEHTKNANQTRPDKQV
jgi:hypothetical protein